MKDGKAIASDPDHDRRLALYRDLVLCREAERYIVDHYHEDEMMTPMHMSMGQEAAPVAVCNALDRKCDVFSSYRSHAVFLAQTRDIEKFFLELYGRVGGTADGKSGSLHLSLPEKGHAVASGIVAAMVAPAVGAAYANKMLGNGQIAVVFLGDGALEEGATLESFNIAQLYKVPVLFVCEDNGFAVNSNKALRHGFPSIEALVQGFGIEYFEDKSNSVESIYRAARAAAEIIRCDSRPYFLHVHCTRYLEHVGIGEDWDLQYRDRAAHDFWFENDCLKLQEKSLVDSGIAAGELELVVHSIRDQVDAAGKAAQQAPKPGRDQLFKGVFHDED